MHENRMIPLSPVRSITGRTSQDPKEGRERVADQPPYPQTSKPFPNRYGARNPLRISDPLLCSPRSCRAYKSEALTIPVVPEIARKTGAVRHWGHDLGFGTESAH